MPRRPRQASSTGIYHIMVRGVNRQHIFDQPADYEFFIDCLRKTLELSGASVYSYCLMSNHVHLLLEEGREPVSVTMKRLGVRYAGWFNRKYDRVGHLFQDRYTSKAVTDDAYFLTVLTYIHFNPVKAGLCTRPEEYRWSSRPTLGQPSSIVDVDRLKELVRLEAMSQVEETHNPEETSQDVLAYEETPPRRTDDDVRQEILEMTGTDSVSSFQCLQAGRQTEVVRRLRSRGVPIRQVSRVTGLNSTLVFKLGLYKL